MKTVSVDRVIVTMTESECDICFDNETTETYLIKWRIKPNSRVYPGTIVLLYGNNNSDVNAKQSCDLKKLKTTLGGIVTHLLKAEGDKIDVG